MVGVSAQEHVGEGHDGIVVKEGLWWVEEERCRTKGRKRRHCDRAVGRRNIGNIIWKIKKGGVRDLESFI